jgi:hypothetical protein
MLRTPQGSGSNATSAKVVGKTYRFPSNERKLEAVSLEKTGDGDSVTLVARFDGADRRLECGRSSWKKGRIAWAGYPEQPAAASGAWTGDDTFTAKICFTETPFVVTIRLGFTDDDVSLESESNVGFGQTRQLTLKGTSSEAAREK